MFSTGQIVLVDTNVILEANRVNCWNALANYFKLTTVETVIEETQTGYQNRAPGQTISLGPLRNSFDKIVPITDEDRAQFSLDNPNVLLDPGERDLIILARSLDPRTTWFLNSPDMAAVRYSHANKWLDRLVSLEAMSKHISARMSSDLRDNFSEGWLSVKKTRLRLDA